MSPLLIMVFGAALLMVLGAGIALLSGRGEVAVDERLEQFVATPPSLLTPELPVTLESPRKAVGDRVDKALIGRGFGENIRSRIAKADAKLRVSEYIILVMLSTVGVAALAYFFFNRSLFVGILGLFVGFRAPGMYLNFAATRRLRTFDGQLSDTLNLWVNSLRSGYSVLQSLEAIATELPAPVSTEFERVVQEVRLGLSLPQALSNMLRRVPSEDLDLVITAVNIQREVGGNLAEILAIISFTIRERVRIKGEIRTLTAQGRISGWVVGLLPLGLALLLYRINPTYVSQLWLVEKPFIVPNVLPCGWLVIGIGLIMIVAGVAVIRKIVNIEV